MTKELPYGPEGLTVLQRVLDSLEFTPQAVTFYDTASKNFTHIICPKSAMMQAICIFVKKEHDFPNYVVASEENETFTVAMRFAMGIFKPGLTYRFESGKFTIPTPREEEEEEEDW